MPTAAGPLPRLLVDLRVPELAHIKQAVSFSHHRVSRQGFPMYYDRLGRIDLPALKKVSSVDELLTYMVWYLSRVPGMETTKWRWRCGL